MLRISDFAKFCNVPVKTLRYYDVENILKPSFVDRYSGYRYYDESKIEELRKILFLKELGFSLKEIKNFENVSFSDKILQIEKQIANLEKNKSVLFSLNQKKENFNMTYDFVKDEKAIGLWKIHSCVKSKSDFKEDRLIKNFKTIFNELYFLPGGEQYWGISWTKNILIFSFGGVKTYNDYEIFEFNGKTYMFVTFNNVAGNTNNNIRVYEKIDSKRYKKDEIRVKEDINLKFEFDKKAVGEWEAIDFVSEIKNFGALDLDINKDLYLKKIELQSNGVANLYTAKGVFKNHNKWTNGKIIFVDDSVANNYYIKTIDGKVYMFMEWKSGDYIFGKMKPKFYVLQKI